MEPISKTAQISSTERARIRVNKETQGRYI
jgi:hypothetical protein